MAESHPTRAARAAPLRKEFVVEEAPGPQKKIGESQSWTPWWGRMVVLLLVLSCLIWAILHGVAIKNQQELRKELQLLHENNEGRWNETWQKLLQLQQNQTELQRINTWQKLLQHQPNQTELQRIIKQELREELQLLHENNEGRWNETWQKLLQLQQNQTELQRINKQELREELQLLHENNEGRWNETWQKLLQLQQNQTELQRINKQELREELQLLQENNEGRWTETWQKLLQLQQNQTELQRINKQELREELQLLHENNEGRWNETWQKLLQLQQNQTELQRINKQELREELQLLHENNEGRWTETWQKLLQLQQNQTELQRINKLLCQATEDSKKCPSGWQFYMNSCYFFSTHSRSWERARDFCRSFEGDLVVVSTEEEQYFLGKGVQGNNLYWMGVMDKGKWTWVTGKSPTFGFWDVWEEDPDRKLKHCGAMKANGRWTNERCSKYNPWICEKPWDCNFQTSF